MFFKKTAALAFTAFSPVFGILASLRDYRDNLKKVAEWVVDSFIANDIDLVSNMPSGHTYNRQSRKDIKDLYWLQNCNLFAMYAIQPYDASLAKQIEKSYWHWYETEFAHCEEKTEHYLPIGKLPGVNPPEGTFFRAVVKLKDFDGYRIGTETLDPSHLGTISDNDPRSLLKFGVLGAVLKGDRKKAAEYFRKALSLWDGYGFPDPKMSKRKAYCTRYLPYALIAERAVRERIPKEMREAIETRLWSLQDEDGGIWTNYKKDGTPPGIAKKTTEIGPLTLIAYDDCIWPT